MGCTASAQKNQRAPSPKDNEVAVAATGDGNVEAAPKEGTKEMAPVSVEQPEQQCHDDVQEDTPLEVKEIQQNESEMETPGEKADDNSNEAVMNTTDEGKAAETVETEQNAVDTTNNTEQTTGEANTENNIETEPENKETTADAETGKNAEETPNPDGDAGESPE